MKNKRHKRILDLISNNSIVRQEDLLQFLKEDGFDVTQATVSRDIRELRLIKTSVAGEYKYVAPQEMNKSTHTQGRFETIFKESVLNVDFAGNTVLVKCYTGMANAACEVFDSMIWNDVVGTLSGDDTFLVLMKSQQAAEKITQQIAKYIAN